jgi:hypothetical protein
MEVLESKWDELVKKRSVGLATTIMGMEKA